MDSIKRVKLFGDWDKSSMEMADLLRQRTTGMIDNYYYDMEFVNHDYTHAVVFNYPREPIACDPKNVVGLILEPPEILDALYPDRKRGDIEGVGRMFSFVPGTEYPTALGMGFATAKPDTSNIWPHEKEKNVMMICSNKVITPWHHKRQEIFQMLLSSDLPIDFYGRGLVPNQGGDERIKGEIASYGKGEILRQYKCCIDFENSPYAITDKFFDAVLSNTFPITNTYGLEAFDIAGSYSRLNFLGSLENIFADIHSLCNAWNEYQAVAPALMEAKQQIMMGDMNLTRWIYDRIRECDTL